MTSPISHSTVQSSSPASISPPNTEKSLVKITPVCWCSSNLEVNASNINFTAKEKLLFFMAIKGVDLKKVTSMNFSGSLNLDGTFLKSILPGFPNLKLLNFDTCPKGTVSEVIFKSSFFKCGAGSIIFPDRSIYTGPYTEGKPHGEGTFTDSEGNGYSGNWNRGVKEGIGTMCYTDGSVFKGEWKEDERFAGIMKFADGGEFIGKFKDGYFAFGKMSYPDGCTYEGTFEQEKQHGEGIFTSLDGHSYRGRWHEGALQQVL